MPNNAKLPTRCICGAVASDALLNNLQTTVCSCNNFKLLQPKGKLSRQNWIKGNMKLFSVSQLPSKWMRIYVRMTYIWQGWQEALSGPKFAHVQLLTMSNGTEEHKTFYVVIQTQVSRFVQFGCLLQTPSDLERPRKILCTTTVHHWQSETLSISSFIQYCVSNPTIIRRMMKNLLKIGGCPIYSLSSTF